MGKAVIKIIIFTITVIATFVSAIFAEAASANGEMIRKQIRTKRVEFRKCYSEGLKVNPRLEGKTELSWTINDQGEAENIRVTKRVDKKVDRCLAKVLSEIKFPKSAKDTVTQVVYPFVFAQAPFDNNDIRTQK